MSPGPDFSAWRLAPGVHAAVVDDDVVLLDIAADSYACVPGGASAMCFAPFGQTLSILEPELADELAQAGLIWPGAAAASTAAILKTAPWPTASALQPTYPTPKAADAKEAAAALSELVIHYRGRSFAELLRRAAARPAVDGAVSPALLAAVDRFHRWVPYAPVSAKCLLRSFLLLGCLRRQGLNALWVFGVATWPFSAHCWLQCGETVLDETVERARAYTPILVI